MTGIYLHRTCTDSEARYIILLEFDDEFEIRTYVDDCRAATFRFYYEILKGDKVAVTGKTTHCFTRDGRPVNIKKAMPEFMEAMEKHKR